MAWPRRSRCRCCAARPGRPAAPPVATAASGGRSSGSTAGGFQVSLAASGDDFPLRLPVRARFADGSEVKQALSFGGGAGQVQFATSSRPAVIEIDPGWTAVREIRPALEGDVSLDGRVDGADLIEVALRLGRTMPSERRRDGKYDPLYDLDADRTIGDSDLDRVVARAAAP